ncbi:ferritin-like domain-containing protein [Nannocystis bainbridge]|uniref:Ferritin-like domain-containing protein n=1 Tax=Nannocystis bainbridge TaxID=2995303 RepID=A0ABT5E957_9BACT|nr:ferritin-like domain-containing protein [Nannocystis bainbridge]MDC0722395.1 ferritin-like domain-containing protein [Nannocystis bainbridge]
MRSHFAVTRAFYVELMAALGLVAACGGASSETNAGTEPESTSTSSTTSTTGAVTSGPLTGTTDDPGELTATTEGVTTSTSEATTAPGTTTTPNTITGEETTSTTGETSGTTTSTTTTTGEPGTTDEPGEFTCEPPPPGLMQKYVCFPVPDGLADCAACDEACSQSWANAAATGDPFCSYTDLTVQCGPDPMPAAPDQCCYFVAHGDGMVCEGRPFMVEGAGRVAPSLRRSDWQGQILPSLTGLDEPTRAALAELWGATAAEEHASVASFARFALQLLAIGAPASLVDGAQRAMADEIAHARACYALAGAYAGSPMGPGRLDMSDALGDSDLPALAAAAVREGCVGETLAALLAQVAAFQTSDYVVRSVLRQIAVDEGRHSQLAWRFVQWALGRSPAVREAVREAFAAALREPVGVRPWPADADPELLRAHGRLMPDEQVTLCRDALIGVIGPAADALLGRADQAAAAAA